MAKSKRPETEGESEGGFVPLKKRNKGYSQVRRDKSRGKGRRPKRNR